MNVESYTNYRVGERFLKKLFRLIFYCPAPAARTVGHFTPSLEAKSASSSGVPMSSCSERAASAFHCPAPPPSPSCLRTFRTRRQKASSVRKNLSQQG